MLGIESSFLRLQALGPDAADFAEVARLKRKRVRMEAGDAIIFEGQHKRAGYLLISGWACSIRHLKNGSGQVIDFRIPGDLIGVGELLAQQSMLSYEAITPVELCEISVGDLVALTSRAPRVIAAIMWAISCDHAIATEHLINLGRRNPKVRTAHLLLELATRLSCTTRGKENEFSCPLSQYMLADALGLTAVHLNRVLRQLREEGLVSFRRSLITIHDRQRMVEFAGFDPAYLGQEALGQDSPLRRLAGLREKQVEREEHHPEPRSVSSENHSTGAHPAAGEPRR